MSDTYWMEQALERARRAEGEGEVPVGAVLVKDGLLVGEGWNRPIGANDPTAHAEVNALRDAAERLGNYRLPGTTLYVTLEPCPMCVGAMIHARVERVVFGAFDPKTGACGRALDLAHHPSHNHHLIVDGGVMAEPAAELLRTFFRRRRAESRSQR